MKNTQLITKEYIIPRTAMRVFVFVTGPYREDNKFHQFHKCRRVWATAQNGMVLQTSAKRTRQVEKFCNQIHAKRRTSAQ